MENKYFLYAKDYSGLTQEEIQNRLKKYPKTTKIEESPNKILLYRDKKQFERIILLCDEIACSWGGSIEVVDAGCLESQITIRVKEMVIGNLDRDFFYQIFDAADVVAFEAIDGQIKIELSFAYESMDYALSRSLDYIEFQNKNQF